MSVEMARWRERQYMDYQHELAEYERHVEEKADERREKEAARGALKDRIEAVARAATRSTSFCWYVSHSEEFGEHILCTWVPGKNIWMEIMVFVMRHNKNLYFANRHYEQYNKDSLRDYIAFEARKQRRENEKNVR